MSHDDTRDRDPSPLSSGVLQCVLQRATLFQLLLKLALTSDTATRYTTLHHTAPHRNSLHHTAPHCNTLQHTATHCNTMQHTATHCNTLLSHATHCNKQKHLPEPLSSRRPSPASTSTRNIAYRACMCAFGATISDSKYILMRILIQIFITLLEAICFLGRGGGLGSRPKKMYGERLGDGAEYHLMKPTPPSTSTIYNGA